MRHLNYNHLLYFWTVAREGSIAKAAQVLHLTPQTISGQLKSLEKSIGQSLFRRVGRGLAVTDTGLLVNQYADEIFSLGAELALRMRDEEPGATTVFTVGIASSVAKLIAFRLIEPALTLEKEIRLVCVEAPLDQLLADLAVHRIDLIVADRPIPEGLNVKGYSHKLGESTVSFFCQRGVAEDYADDFPNSLQGAKVLLPVVGSAMRRRLDDWFEAVGVRPRIVAEFDDSALLKAFGEAGVGLFPAPTVIADQISDMYHAAPVGEVSDVKDRYFVISPERRLKHPAVVKITKAARDRLDA